MQRGKFLLGDVVDATGLDPLLQILVVKPDLEVENTFSGVVLRSSPWSFQVGSEYDKLHKQFFRVVLSADQAIQAHSTLTNTAMYTYATKLKAYRPGNHYDGFNMEQPHDFPGPFLQAIDLERAQDFCLTYAPYLTLRNQIETSCLPDGALVLDVTDFYPEENASMLTAKLAKQSQQPEYDSYSAGDIIEYILDVGSRVLVTQDEGSLFTGVIVRSPWKNLSVGEAICLPKQNFRLILTADQPLTPQSEGELVYSDCQAITDR